MNVNVTPTDPRTAANQQPQCQTFKPFRFGFPPEPKFPSDPTPKCRLPRFPHELYPFLPAILRPQPLGMLPPFVPLMKSVRMLARLADELRQRRDLFVFPEPDSFFGCPSRTGFVSFPARVEECLSSSVPYPEWGSKLRRDVFLGLLLNLAELRAVYAEVERRSRSVRVARSQANARYLRRARALSHAHPDIKLSGPVPDSGLAGRANQRLEAFVQYRYELVPLVERALGEILPLFAWMRANAPEELVGLELASLDSQASAASPAPTSPVTSPATSPATSLVKPATSPVTPHTPPSPLRSAPSAPAPLSRSTCGKPGVPNWPNPKSPEGSLSTSSYDVDDERNNIV